MNWLPVLFVTDVQIKVAHIHRFTPATYPAPPSAFQPLLAGRLAAHFARYLACGLVGRLAKSLDHWFLQVFPYPEHHAHNSKSPENPDHNHGAESFLKIFRNF